MRASVPLLTGLRALVPWARLAAAVAGLLAGALALDVAGFRWDPFDLSSRRLERAERAAVLARAEAAARSAEAAGQAGQLARLADALHAARSLERATSRSIQTARLADDAALPLPPDRVDRLRDHDRELCRIAPALGGCAAAPDPARPGEPAL